ARQRPHPCLRHPPATARRRRPLRPPRQPPVRYGRRGGVLTVLLLWEARLLLLFFAGVSDPCTRSFYGPRPIQPPSLSSPRFPLPASRFPLPASRFPRCLFFFSGATPNPVNNPAKCHQ